MTSPIQKVLSTLSSHNVRSLLIGGQACIFYGGAEFSRDADIAVLTSPENLRRLERALVDLQADTIAVPPFAPEYLERGHAVHFRCAHPDAAGMRIDVIAVMRGVDSFEALWERRTTVDVAPGESYEVIALQDLVQSKKTQRDKDWPMIRRLIEAHYVANRARPAPAQVEFWLLESRTPAMLREVAGAHPAALRRTAPARPFLSALEAMDDAALEGALDAEEKREREADRAYWKPLREELERLRLAR
ncbi:MAG TPA: hypothetical protein VML00_11050 [Bacteroidota bacterium]|nr:hypothetical protein [Bacteroidota bacterium]